MPANTRINTLQELLKKEPNDVFLNYALGLEFAALPANADITIAQFLKTISLDPEYIAAYYQLAKFYEVLAKKTEALTYFEIGLKIAEQKRDLKTVNEFKEAIFLLED